MILFFHFEPNISSELQNFHKNLSLVSFLFSGRERNFQAYGMGIPQSVNLSTAKNLIRNPTTKKIWTPLSLQIPNTPAS